jgi:subtilase family serine protease
VRRRTAFVLALLLAAAIASGAMLRGGTAAQPVTAVHEPVTVDQARAVSRRLGSVPPGREIHLALALRPRDERTLDRLFLGDAETAAGRSAARLGPDPRLVRTALRVVQRAGFRTSWSVGDAAASAAGPARLVEDFFKVRLARYMTPGGRRFYAGLGEAEIPAQLRAVVIGVAGLDDWPRAQPAAIPVGGVAPADVLSFYNVLPLRAKGLDGSGETVVFPELNSPLDAPQLRHDLDAYAKKYHLPPFDLTVRTKLSWKPVLPGTSTAEGGLAEAALDLEIVHALAPGAKLKIYEEGSNLVAGVLAEQAMVRENKTAIISDSIGFCESVVTNSGVRRVIESPWRRQAAQNMTHYAASGDSGAYTCGQNHPPAVDFTAAIPAVTGVGGTSVLLAANGGYYRELAWGNALTRAGGGGGISRIYARPAYQDQVPGAPASNARLVPDVAALADSNTGWHIIVGGAGHQIGGTSAAAPFWAGLTALINQDMRRHGLRRVGFANPALYWIAKHQERFHAFHDVTAGNNLLYDAGTGWDAATGLGTPDVAALDVAWRAYIRARGT